MSERYDIIFAGAGLAGLSLAVRLAALPEPPRILLVDSSCEPPRDRTWCHWQLHDHPFTDAITNRWHDWIVSSTLQRKTARSISHPYVRIPSDRLQHIARQKLSAAPHAEFLTGISVTTLKSHPDHATAHLSDGHRITASWIFDSRPPQNMQAPWRQIFRGLELHSNSAHLDTSAVTLMDFISADDNGIRFFYILPLDPQTALVEDTWLTPTGRTPSFSDDEILTYASRKLAPTTWRIVHREEGNLPMGLQTVKSKGRVIPWGTPSGALRASSGYAFSRIQKASERMTSAWQRTRRPCPDNRRESILLDWMDHVFLRVMDRYPERVPEFFVRLFDRVPPEALVRFLESEPRATDILQVMSALPPAPFLAAAFR